MAKEGATVKAHFFWHGSPLSYYERQCLASFVQRGAEVYLHAFDIAMDAPPGVRKVDAALLAASGEISLYNQRGSTGSPAAFANIFRYRVLGEEPGWWFDTDIFCIKGPEEFELLEKSCTGILVGAQNARTLNNAVMFVRDTRLAKALEERATRKAAASGGSFPWGTLGPQLMTEFAEDNPERVTVLPVEAFYPLSYRELDLLFTPGLISECRRKAERSFALHFWNEILMRHHIPKSLGPCEGSYLEELLDSAGVQGERPPSLPFETFDALKKAFEFPTGKWELFVIRIMRLLRIQYIKLHGFPRFKKTGYWNSVGEGRS